MYPNLTDLHYFIEIAQLGSLTQAAGRLGLSQPTLSVAINRLEAILGTSLLQRSKKGVQLTPAGRTLLAQARKLIQDWEAVQSKALASHEEVKGQFTIGCHPAVAMYTLPDCLPALMQEHSELEIHLFHDLSRKVLDQVLNVKVDIGIVVNPTQHPDLIIKKVCDDVVTFWISDSHKAAPQDVVISDPDLLQTKDLLRKTKKAGFDFKRSIESSNLQVVAELAQSGCGIGILPTRVALKTGGLRRLKNAPILNDEICIIYRAESRKVLAIKTISNAIEKALKTEK